MMDPIRSAAAFSAPAPPRPKDAAEAAQQFEALLLAQVLREARTSDGLGESDSTGEATWDIAAQQFAQLLAKQGGLGLSKPIVRALDQ